MMKCSRRGIELSCEVTSEKNVFLNKEETLIGD